MSHDPARHDAYPLTPVQEGMLFHALYDPASRAYFSQYVFSLRGALDAAAMRRAWQAAVARHAVLRSSFAWQGVHRPLQVVADAVELPWVEMDWRALPPAERQARLDDFRRADREQGFDLARAPLMRLALIRHAADQHDLVWSLHHLLLDGWSSPLVLRDVLALYAAFADGRDLHLPTPRPFRDFVAWLEARDASGAEAFWRAALDGVEAPTPLGIAPPAAAAMEDGDTHGVADLRLSAVATAGLRALARGEGVTLNTIVQGAWALLLATYSGEDDVVFGATVAGRPAELEGVEEMVGMFINSVPVRARIDYGAAVGAWLRGLQAMQATAREHEHVPLSTVQGWSEVPRGRPLFESLVVFENFPVDEEMGGGGIEIEAWENWQHTPYPLAIVALPGARLTLRLKHERARIGADAAERMLGHLRVLLESIAADPAARVGDLSPLDAAERARVITALNRALATRSGGSSAADPAGHPRSGDFDARCIHERFAEQAARTPDAVAVMCGDASLTYRELDARANRLAHHLRGLGAGPEAHAGILLDRSVEMVMAIVAVWKAGGAYLPLDPAAPPERIAALVRDAGATVVLTRSRLRGLIPAEVRAVCVDAEALDPDIRHHAVPGDAPDTGVRAISGTNAEALDSDIHRHAVPGDALDAAVDAVASASDATPASVATGESTEDAAPASGARPENAAYVIYTSGSTGAPKGVVVQHRSVANLADALGRAIYAPRAAARPPRVTLNGAITFDTSVKQIVQLLSGATLCIVPEEARYDADALEAWLRDSEAEVFDCTPAQLRLLAANGALGRLPALTDVLVAGEAVDEALWRALGLSSPRPPSPELQEKGENCNGNSALAGDAIARPPAREAAAAPRWPSFHNLYGPTEVTVDATHAVIEGASPTIGRPLANTASYVLDARMRPVPIGIAGELYVGGEGVARGYLGRAAATAERFVPDPFGGAGARLYRTGDRVRWRPNGSLAFLGRADGQVKVRGMRIEPGEIEAALRALPGVREAVVAGRQGTGDEGQGTGDEGQGTGDRGQGTASAAEVRLVAWVVADGVAFDAAALRAGLRRTLPEALVPSAFVPLDALPLTRNGKVDRRALPDPDEVASPDEFVAPRTPVEARLAEIWSEVLDCGPVGAEDDFFARGGHSLLATRVTSRAREAFAIDLPVRALFDAPTLATLAARIEAAGGDLLGDRIERISQEGPLPLSFAQQRLWFLDQLQPGSAAYNMATALRMRGALDVGAFRRSLSALVARHEVLRTTFASAGGEPVQVIHAPAPVPLPFADLAALPPAARERELRRLARAEAVRPFDLARGPLLRATLVRLGADDHAVLFTLHHVVSDGWSTGVMVREVSALYAAYSAGEDPHLPALPVQYADYAAWQRQRLSGDALAAHLGWWRETLAGAPPLLELPTDRPRPAVAGSDAAALPFRLGAGAAARLIAIAREEGATPFMALLAAWQALLSRYAGEADVVVGTPIAGRTRVETEGLIGVFMNVLPLRGDLAGGPSFRALLRRAREATLGAYQHQELPFERLVDELGVERSLAHAPLVQAMISLAEGEALAGLRLGGLALERMEGAAEQARFDLDLELIHAEGAIHGTLLYRTELWDEPTVERMLGHLARLIEGAIADPDAAVDALPLMGDDERRRVLAEWNATEAPRPAAACVHHLFEAQAARTPGATALITTSGRLAYAELNGRANRLARHLRALGVGPESHVGVCLPRGADLVVALLAVLKAGGAYVPMDPAYPADRIAYMLDDSQATVLVTHAALAGRIRADEMTAAHVDADRHDIAAIQPEHPGRVAVRIDADRHDIAANQAEDPGRVAVVRVDADREAISVHDSGDVEGGAGAENIAYLIYTSGSTGRPKGVEVRHGAVVGFLGWAESLLTADDLSGTLASTSVSFDISVLELYTPLATGGAIVLVDDVLHLPEHPAAAEVRWVNTVPSAALALASAGRLPPTVKTVTVGGEAVAPEVVEALFATGTVRRVLDFYGPTEDTVYSTFAARLPGAPASIGRPLHNRRAYVLDARWNPVPQGVAGELYLGGDGTARGYWRRPSLTAERFVPDPFGPADARLYRTGDRARWRPDGTLEYLGRVDHQVKVRGFRIEPGEVEAVLRREPGVREAVVVAREDVPGDRRLVAYVVPAGRSSAGESASAAQAMGRGPDLHLPTTAGRSSADESRSTARATGRGHDPHLPTPAGLRAGLRRTLPEHLVPDAFVLLEALPRTPNGKIDRKALPAPEATSSDRYLAPRTPTEEVTAAIWAAVLGLDRVGAYDDFFALGGHSLLATRVAARAREAFGVELPLRALFEAPTVAGLAARIDAARGSGVATLPPIVPVPRDGHLPLSFQQQRLWFLDRLEPGSAAYNLPAALRIRGPIDRRALRRALDLLVARHEALRTTLAEHDGWPAQVIHPPSSIFLPRTADEDDGLVHPPSPIPLPVVDVRGLGDVARERELRTRAMADAARPFDLARGPLLRATLLWLGDDDHALLFTLHHVIADGWSLDVLVREATAAYEAFARGASPDLPPLSVQYADYAAWQRAHLAGDALEAQLAWWRERLAGAPPLLEMPTDRPRPAVAGSAGARLPVTLPAETARAVRELARREGATPFMVLLAAWQALLARYSGQADVLVASPVAGRSRVETEGLIGFFVNTLVLRADLSGAPGFRALVRQAREATLEAHRHQDLPFERLVDELRVERSLAHAPLAQALFALQPAAEPLSLGDAEVTAMEVDGIAARYDLALALEDDGARIAGGLSYRTDLWDAVTIRRMLGHFARLLEGALADPDLPAGAIALPGDAERHTLLREWNPRPDGAAGFLHHRFAAHVRRAPDAVAVAWEGDRMSYTELDRRSSQLANHLRRRGAGPEVRVGVCLERGPEMAIAFLAVLRAGAAYLPLDPAYPAERLAFMLADSAVPLLVTRDGPSAALPAHAAEVVRLDADEAAIDAEPGEAPEPPLHPEGLAYVIYTSGSTGTPKGVGVPHRGLVNVAEEQARAFGVSAGDRVLQFASPGFDASVFEMVMAFGAGAALVPATGDARLGGPALGDLLRREAVSVVTLPPSALAALPAEPLPALRTITVAGEACPPGVVAAWAPGRRFFNLYGPTEATIWSSTHHCEPDGARPPIGTPVGGTTAYVVDAWLNPSPIGVAGELLVGGIGVARGYLGRPALTAETFIPHPFDGAPGERVYRTGDRVRWRGDGVLEFLGRTDDQVKVRGFRIEPGEVEAALVALCGAREAAVVAREDAPGDRRLVAYLVPANGAMPGAGALRERLRSVLPEYMVPAAFVALDALPLTPNGKVDRRALPAPRYEGDAESYVAPASEAETVLAEVWARVLGVERVGMDDNFFDLGGDSILSIQVVSRARAAGVEITPRQLFEHPTVGRLARVASPVNGTSGDDDAPVAGEVPLTPIQRWFFAQDIPQRHHWNQAVLLAPREPIDMRRLEMAVARVMEHHDALRARYRPPSPESREIGENGDGTAAHVARNRTEIPDTREPPPPRHPSPLVGEGPGEGGRRSMDQCPPTATEFSCAMADAAGADWTQTFASPGGWAPVHRIDLSGLSEDARQRAMGMGIARVQASLDLARGPLLRVALFDLGDGGARLQIVVHHLVMDGVSWRVLLEDLETAYRAEPLPPRTTSFARWAARLAEHAASPALGAEAGHWLTVARAPVPPLPVDRPGGSNRADAAADVVVALAADETHALLHEVPAIYRTQANDVLLAGLARALAAWSGERVFRIDLEGHGREELFPGVDLSRTVGWFTALYPVLLDLRGADDEGAALRAVKEQLRAVPARGVGHGVLRWLSPDGEMRRALAGAPVPDLGFNYLGQLDSTLSAGSLFAAAGESAGPSLGRGGERPHRIEVNAAVLGGALQVRWTFSHELHDRATIERLAERYLAELRALAAHCATAAAPAATPSDFPLAAIDAHTLALLEADFLEQDALEDAPA